VILVSILNSDSANPGPVVSHAVPALTSIFGGTERKIYEDNMAQELSNLTATHQQVVDLIQGVRLALQAAHDDIKMSTAQITDEIQKASLSSARRTLDRYYDTLNAAM
jgi:hypothetical protein